MRSCSGADLRSSAAGGVPPSAHEAAAAIDHNPAAAAVPSGAWRTAMLRALCWRPTPKRALTFAPAWQRIRTACNVPEPRALLANDLQRPPSLPLRARTSLATERVPPCCLSLRHTRAACGRHRAVSRVPSVHNTTTCTTDCATLCISHGRPTRSDRALARAADVLRARSRWRPPR